jgi:hypothetical protein
MKPKPMFATSIIKDEAESRAAREERALKPHYWPKWLDEAGVIAFLDFLLADLQGMVTPDNPTGDYALHLVHLLQRARALREQLADTGSA